MNMCIYVYIITYIFVLFSFSMKLLMIYIYKINKINKIRYMIRYYII